MLSRSECFKVLGLDESAGPNAIKRSYRKLAFELHPDLHPDLPDASKRFQQLNEAYVMLMQEYANTSFAAGKRHTARSASGPGFSDAGFGQRPGSGVGAGAAQSGQGAAGHKTRAEARKAYEKARRSQKREQAGNADNATGQQASQRPEGGYTWAGEPPSGKSARSARSGNTASEAESTAYQTGAAGSYQAGARQPSREEILKDLLNDPFARRVFEDIYSHVRYNAGKTDRRTQLPPRAQPKPKIMAKAKPARKSALEAVGSKMAGLASGIKGWLRKQIDEEQTMFLPGEALLPGARLRLKVQQGLSDEKKTIELTLPPEFAPGKPIRLKGLGRRLGGVQGDLYLRIYSNSESE